ncbi:MAG: 4'-phosphopantetheinyl transferase superfamily protein [Oscillospiraceae bacterium]|nr:4'-phosphopantetheinyl transferase superfamily protein [Oscillospiraceae bacterium]
MLHKKSYALLKKALGYYGIHDPDIENNIEKNHYGKPYLKNIPLFFNISHCRGLAACAVHTSEIGIDAENIREYKPGILKRVLTPGELAYFNECENKDEIFFRLWTLKESYIKNIGMGLAFPLGNIEFDISDIRNIKSSDGGKKFGQISVGEYIVSVCVDTDSEFDAEYKFEDV